MCVCVSARDRTIPYTKNWSLRWNRNNIPLSLRGKRASFFCVFLLLLLFLEFSFLPAFALCKWLRQCARAYGWTGNWWKWTGFSLSTATCIESFDFPAIWQGCSQCTCVQITRSIWNYNRFGKCSYHFYLPKSKIMFDEFITIHSLLPRLY